MYVAHNPHGLEIYIAVDTILLLQSQNLRVNQEKKPYIRLTQENSMEFLV